MRSRIAVSVASIGYWALLPGSLLLLARWIDTALPLPRIPWTVGLGIGVPLISSGLIGACWCGVAFYLRGGGFPLAFFPPNRLVREGPYALSRHPLYLSFTIYLTGLGLLIRSIAGVGIVIPGVGILWILYAHLHEEPVIARRYGTSYAEYKAAVPFFFRLRRENPGPGVVFSLVYLLGKLIIALFFPIEVEGEEKIPQVGPCIVLANHASYLDPAFLIATSGRYIRFLTTAEMMRSRFGRWFFRSLGAIPTRRYRIDAASVRAFLAALNASEIVGIFPEGERTWDGSPLPVVRTVKRLLRRAGVPLVTARIEGSYAIYPRWSGHPLPGRVRISFSPPSPPEKVADALTRIRVQSDGRTFLPRRTGGLERLIWACPACQAIGQIKTSGRILRCISCGAAWKIDRSLYLSDRDRRRIPLWKFVSFLSDERLFRGLEALASIGPVDLSAGGDELSPLASGEVTYSDSALHVDGKAFPVHGARVLRLEGRDRLDIGFTNGYRLRLKFHCDSPLKWERFLRTRLKIA